MTHPLFRLGARLALCASMVRPGVRLADIGTDHAYLPVWLAREGIVEHAAAADINPLPLDSARGNIQKYGVEGTVEARLSDGLAAFCPSDADDIVIAGMGGDLIARILDGAPWLKSPEKHLILQPMTSAEVLRSYLSQNGFAVLREEAAQEEHRVYSVLLAAYAPGKVRMDALFYEVGELNGSTPESCAYMEKRAATLEKKSRGLSLAGDFEAAEKAEGLAVQIRGLLRGKGAYAMICVADIFREIDSFAPFSTALDYDNVGLLVGDGKTAVHTVLFSLDITPEVVREAVSIGAELLVSHHPVIFDPLRRLDPDCAPWLLARHGLAAICAHTNLDLAEGGVNTCLAGVLSLKNVRPFCFEEHSGLAEGLMGDLEEEMTPAGFAAHVKAALGCDGLKYTDGKQKIRLAAVCGGAGGFLLEKAARAGAQAFVTSDTKHDQLLTAERLGVTLVDAGHFYTEDVVIAPLMERLRRSFPGVRFEKSCAMHNSYRYLPNRE